MDRIARRLTGVAGVVADACRLGQCVVSLKSRAFLQHRPMSIMSHNNAKKWKPQAQRPDGTIDNSTVALSTAGDENSLTEVTSLVDKAASQEETKSITSRLLKGT